jgi:hypothetical protein
MKKSSETITIPRLRRALATLLAVRDAHPATEGIDDLIRRFAREIKARLAAEDELAEARRLAEG